MNTTQELTAGQTATMIAAPGYPTQARYTIVSVEGRSLTAVRSDCAGAAAETFTLRRNGKYALKGGGQWAEYLRAVKR